MSKVHYEGPERFRPIGAWGYVGYTLLLSLPLLGLIVTLVFACSDSHIARRNYARSMLCWRLLWALALGGIVFSALSDGGVRAWFRMNLPPAEKLIRQLVGIVSAGKDAARALPAAAPTAAPTAAPKTTAAPKRTAAPAKTAAPTSAPTAAPAGSKNASGGIRDSVREAIDGYEAFFREYAELMKKVSRGDGAAVMTEYLRMLSLYAENMAEWEAFEEDHDLNDAEALYFAQASLRIEAMLLEAAGQ